MMSVDILYVTVRLFIFFFFKQKTAYEMLISDWSSDVCSSDLTKAIRFLADWKPSERLSFELNLNAWQNKSDPQAPQAIAIVQQNAAIPSDYPALNIAFAPANGRAADWSPGIRPFANNKFR